MTNKYYGYCPHSYKCSWFQWNVVPEGDQYKVYKLSKKGFEIDFEFSSKTSTHKIMISDRDLNGYMNLVVADGLVVPYSISATTGAESFFSNHIVEVRNGYLDVDAADLNLPMKNRIGDIQIENRGKATIDPLSIVCWADDEYVDCAMNKPAIDVI